MMWATAGELECDAKGSPAVTKRRIVLMLSWRIHFVTFVAAVLYAAFDMYRTYYCGVVIGGAGTTLLALRSARVFALEASSNERCRRRARLTRRPATCCASAT